MQLICWVCWSEELPGMCTSYVWAPNVWSISLTLPATKDSGQRLCGRMVRCSAVVHLDILCWSAISPQGSPPTQSPPPPSYFEIPHLYKTQSQGPC